MITFIGAAGGIAIVFLHPHVGFTSVATSLAYIVVASIVLITLGYALGVRNPVWSAFLSTVGANIFYLSSLVILSALTLESVIFITKYFGSDENVRIKEIISAAVVLIGLVVADFRGWLERLSPLRLNQRLFQNRYKKKVPITQPGHQKGIVYDDASLALWRDPASLSEGRSISGWGYKQTIRRLDFIRTYLCPEQG